jgi:hypothetical protein
VVVFFYSSANEAVAKCVEGVVLCLNPINYFASHVFALPIDLDNREDAVMALQDIIYGLPEI